MAEFILEVIVEEFELLEVAEKGDPGTSGGDTPHVVSDLGTLGATLVMNMQSKGKAEFEAATSATALTISIPNPPAIGLAGEATIICDFTTLPASIAHPAGTVDAPTITAAVWELNYKTIDGGTTWRVIGKEWSA